MNEVLKKQGLTLPLPAHQGWPAFPTLIPALLPLHLPLPQVRSSITTSSKAVLPNFTHLSCRALTVHICPITPMCPAGLAVVLHMCMNHSPAKSRPSTKWAGPVPTKSEQSQKATVTLLWLLSVCHVFKHQPAAGHPQDPPQFP